jgi:hypothetical protein
VRRQDVAVGSGNVVIKRAASNASADRRHLTAAKTSTLQSSQQAGIASSRTRIFAASLRRSADIARPVLRRIVRGRDNLRVTLNGPRTFKHLRSAIVPLPTWRVSPAPWHRWRTAVAGGRPG